MIKRIENPPPEQQDEANELRHLYDEHFAFGTSKVVLSAMCGAIANHYLNSSDETFAIAVRQIGEALAYERRRLKAEGLVS